MNQGNPTKNKKATRSTYLAAGSLASLRSSLQGSRMVASTARSKNGKQKHPWLGSQVQEQLQQMPLHSTSPAEHQLQEQVQQVPLHSIAPTSGAIPKSGHKASLHSTSLATKAIRENENHMSLGSTSPSIQPIPKNPKKMLLRSTSFATNPNPENGLHVSLHSTSHPSTQVVLENGQQGSQDTTSHETNENSTEKGPSVEKKKRGRTQMQKVHGRTERKQILLNNHNQPIAPLDAVVELSSFLGTLARNSTFCPLTVRTWKKVNTKNDMWKYVKAKYDIPDVGKKWVLKTIQDAWRSCKCRLKKRHFKAYANDADRMKNRPKYVPESEFKALLDFWNSDEAQKTSRINTENRKKMRYPHTVGKRSFAIIREEKQKETTNVVTKKDIFVATRTRNPNRVYKESYEDTIQKIAEMERMQTHEETENGGQSADAFASVMGPEHPGNYVRLYGRGVTKKILNEKVRNTESSTDEITQQKMKEMEERMTQKMLEKLEDRRVSMQQEVAINIIARLQHLNPGLQLDPDMLAFCARSRSRLSREASSSQGGENAESEDESMEDHS